MTWHFSSAAKRSERISGPSSCCVWHWLCTMIACSWCVCGMRVARKCRLLGPFWRLDDLIRLESRMYQNSFQRGCLLRVLRSLEFQWQFEIQKLLALRTTVSDVWNMFCRTHDISTNQKLGRLREAYWVGISMNQFMPNKVLTTLIPRLAISTHFENGLSQAGGVQWHHQWSFDRFDGWLMSCWPAQWCGVHECVCRRLGKGKSSKVKVWSPACCMQGAAAICKTFLVASSDPPSSRSLIFL